MIVLYKREVFFTSETREPVHSFQFFDAFAKSLNYRHTVQLRNQEQEVYFDRQTVTLVEVAKFLKNAKDYVGDNCRLETF